jgi:hypothetical protein
MNITKTILLAPAAALLSLAPLGATILMIDENFTTNTTSGWSFVGQSTTGNTPGSLAYVAAGTSFSFGPHDGAMRWRPEHTGTSTDQATLIFRLSGITENASGFTLSTTGIHARNTPVNIRLAIQYFEDGSAKWAVSDQSIRTSSGTSAPVAGSWDFSTLTFSSLDSGNLLAGPGTAIASSTVLENVTGIGVYSRFLNQQWMADHATQIDSFTVIPEPQTYAAIFGLMAFGFILWRRRR